MIISCFIVPYLSMFLDRDANFFFCVCNLVDFTVLKNKIIPIFSLYIVTSKYLMNFHIDFWMLLERKMFKFEWFFLKMTEKMRTAFFVSTSNPNCIGGGTIYSLPSSLWLSIFIKICICFFSYILLFIYFMSHNYNRHWGLCKTKKLTFFFPHN